MKKENTSQQPATPTPIQEGGWTKGKIKVSKDGNDIETDHKDSPTGICAMYAYEWADKDAARIVECWNEYDGLKAENERLKKQKEIAMRIALEFGYKQCEKGNNLEMAFLNYEKTINNKP